ncbi:hypothetical protein ACFX13_044415 [Malus domestica]
MLWQKSIPSGMRPSPHRSLLSSRAKKQKEIDKLPYDKNKPRSRHKDRSLTKRNTAPKTFTKFSVPINQILCDLKDKPWFKMLQPMRGDTSKMDQTKYCAFHRGPGHATNNCTTWMKYLEELVKEDKCD